MFLGIDPSSTAMGYAVVDDTGQAIEWGTWAATGRPAARLLSLRESMASWLSMSRDGLLYASIEEPFIRKEVAKSALILTGGYWAAIFECSDLGLPVATLKPTAVKKLAGLGPRAGKKEIVTAVRSMFGIDGALNDHEADALLIALHAKWAYLTGETTTVL